MGTCRICGCTDDDCSQCIAATGEPCSWVEPDLCSRCADLVNQVAFPVEARDELSPCYGCRQRYEYALARWVQQLDADEVQAAAPERPGCPCGVHGRGVVTC